MALQNLINPATAGEQLAGWYSRRHPHLSDVAVTDVTIPHANGMSSETVLFDVQAVRAGTPSSASLVARVAPTGGGLFPTYDLARERQVMDAVAATTPVPVPATVGVEEDGALLGAPFLVMERLRGRVPSDDPPFSAQGWVLELTREQRSALYDNALVAMAGIQRCDLGRLPADMVGHPGSGSSNAQQVQHYDALRTWGAGGFAHPVLDAGFLWVRDNLPSVEGSIGLSWGDARIGNMMFGDDLSVAGVLDWEMASLGEAELDLAWFLFLNRNHTEGMGLPQPSGFPGRDETVQRYEQLIGRPLSNLPFHEVFAAVRATTIMMRVGTFLIEAGLLPPDATMPVDNPASQLLAGILGMERPGDQAAWITGAR